MNYANALGLLAISLCVSSNSACRTRKPIYLIEAQLESHLQSLINHCSARGGGFAIGLINVDSEESQLRLGTLKTIANSLQLAIRPMDTVSRFDSNTFAVSIYYENPDAFNVDLFHRLIASIKRHTHQTSDEGKPLNISAGLWHGHELDPQPSAEEVISNAQSSMVSFD